MKIVDFFGNVTISDRQTDRQTHRQTNRQTDRQTDKHAYLPKRGQYNAIFESSEQKEASDESVSKVFLESPPQRGKDAQDESG